MKTRITTDRILWATAVFAIVLGLVLFVVTIVVELKVGLPSYQILSWVTPILFVLVGVLLAVISILSNSRKDKSN